MNNNIDLSWLPENIQVLDGYDSAIIGITPTDNLVYSFEKCIEIVEDTLDMEFESAVAYTENVILTNQEPAKNHPVFVKDIF